MMLGNGSAAGGKRRLLYGRRRGRRLRPGRRALIAELLPQLAVTLPAGEAASVDPVALFTGSADVSVPTADFLKRKFSPRDVWLEIGFGAGEHLAAQAWSHAEIGFIGCEPYIDGVTSLLRRIEQLGLNNVRVLMDDAAMLLQALSGASIGRAELLFPDPWPKKRHHKRRFVSPANLDLLARVLKDGAELRVASDDSGYVRWILEHVLDHPDFAWLARNPRAWRNRPADSQPTRYESKARAQGRACVFLRFARRRRARG